MEDQTDISKHILIVLLILAIAGGGYLYYLRTQDKKKIDDLESQYSQLRTKYNTLLSEQTTSPSPSPTATSDWKTYKNDKYGFTLTFNNSWKEYKSEQDIENYNDSGIHYRFYLPTTDTSYKTDKSNYASPFVISIYKLADWDAMDKEEAAKFTLIEKSDKYAFVYSTWDQAPTDLKDKITDSEIKSVMETFKLP